MSITLNLAPEEEAQIRQKAASQGREAENYVTELALRDIHSIAGSQPDNSSNSLAEMLAGRVGLFESDEPGYNSQEAKRAFAEHLAEKQISGNF